MQKRSLFLSLVTCATLVACGGDNVNTAAETQPVAVEAKAEKIETYYAVTKCVDDLFYSGGYDVGDETREAIMSEALALYNQPKYEQSKIDNLDHSTIDTAKYILVYTECLSEEVGNKIVAIAKSHGVEQWVEE